jgi:hypothetical protein
MINIEEKNTRPQCVNCPFTYGYINVAAAKETLQHIVIANFK